MRNRLHVHALAALCAVLLLALGGPRAPVADAAMRGDADAVRALIQSGADVNESQGDGMTALHWAAENGDAALAKLLLKAGARVDVVTRLGSYTPLHLASRNGHGDVVVALLDAGADAMALTSTGSVTPLHFAAAAGNVEAVKALLARGAQVDARETQWGQTPLMFAAAGDRVDAIRVLLDAGADPSLTARVLDLPKRDKADQAAERKHNAEVAAIRRAEQGGGEAADPPPARSGGSAAAAAPRPGAAPQKDPDDVKPMSYADLVGAYGGLTPLLLAVREGHEGATEALLAGGADINQVSAGDQTSPLLMATINGWFDLGLELLQRGADPKVASAAGATPLYATINTEWIPKSRHPQPVHYTQQRTTHLQLMEALLKAGADPNARLTYDLWYTEFSRGFLGIDFTGATPFLRAAHALDVDAMKLLVRYGADPTIPTLKPASRRAQVYHPDAADPSGLPPIPVGGPGVYPIDVATGAGYGEGFAGNVHRHVPDGWLPAVKYLVEELGADVNTADFNGYTPLHNAAARGDNELIEYLVGRGADVTAVARTGQTTVDMANGPVQRVSPFPETIKLLEGLGAKNNHNCVSC